MGPLPDFVRLQAILKLHYSVLLLVLIYAFFLPRLKLNLTCKYVDAISFRFSICNGIILLVRF